MAATETTQRAVGAHLVGGLKAPDARTAIRTAGRLLGRHLHAVTDGETGERSNWYWWQTGKLAAVDGIELAGTKQLGKVDNEEWPTEAPGLAVDESVRSLPDRCLGYADAAIASYQVLRELREENAIPSEVKFQVSLPTPYATVFVWVHEACQEQFYDVYADAMANEVRAIVEAVGADDLVIQYDVMVEIGVLLGQASTSSPLADRRLALDSLRRTLAAVPPGVERGVHLCYGDHKNQHFTVPEDLATCVEVANALAGTIDFVHMPADRNTGRSAGYFEPLRDLAPVERLALGVIDYEGDAARTQEIAEAAMAGGGGRPFAIATECGMARIGERGPDAPTLEQLMELHTRFAAPIR